MLPPLLIALATATWEAPPGCPTESTVLAQVEHLTGRARDDVLAGLAFEGHIRLHGDGFELELTVGSESGTTRKTLQAADCAVLGTSAAVVIAVAAAPASVARTLVPPPEGPETARQPTESIAAEPKATGSSDPLDGPADLGTPRALQGAIRAGTSVGRGILPTIDIGVGVGAGLVGRHFRIDTFASHQLARRTVYPTSDAGARISAWTVALRGGPRLELGTLELHALVGANAGPIVGRGYGVDSPAVARDLWVAVGIAPGARWRFAPTWAVGVDLEVDASVRRPAFAITGHSELYRVPAVTVRGLVGLEWRFPRIVPRVDHFRSSRRRSTQ